MSNQFGDLPEEQRKQLVVELIRDMDRNGILPGSREYNARRPEGYPTSHYVARLWDGSWPTVLEDALPNGLSRVNCQKSWRMTNSNHKRQLAIETMRQLARGHVAPTVEEWNAERPKWMPKAKSIMILFGTLGWENVVHEAGLKAAGRWSSEDDIEICKVGEGGYLHPTVLHGTVPVVKRIWHTQRYAWVTVQAQGVL